jgi:ABC-2 type transport system ATP-binding protein
MCTAAGIRQQDPVRGDGMAEVSGLIEVRELTKRFGDKVAVDHLSFSVLPGRVTGFLGPNGAGKTTIGL